MERCGKNVNFAVMTHEDSFPRPARPKPARFPITLRLPAPDPSPLEAAAAAVKREFEENSGAAELISDRIDLLGERGRGVVAALHVGGTVRFEWAWEGAKAVGGIARSERNALPKPAPWEATVLEVDEPRGCLYVEIEDPTDRERMPTTGPFSVRPFEHLGPLEALYTLPGLAGVRSLLPARLAAAAGGHHPAVDPPAQLSPTGDRGPMGDAWGFGWAALWGPPGTGKTYSTGHQVAAALHDPTERVLVISTTNRATDAAALSIGRAVDAKILEKVCRIGRGAALADFVAAGLATMLRGVDPRELSTVAELRRQAEAADDPNESAMLRLKIEQVRAGSQDQSGRRFLDPDVRGVITTAASAVRRLTGDGVVRMLEAGDAPFTTVFIDEAGLISRATVAALSLLAARRVVLVGDPKQLAPIAKGGRLLPTRRARWLASSGMSHLNDPSDAPAAVKVLSEQRRMHPAVCRVVSDYQYGGVLTTAPARAAEAGPAIGSLAGIGRAAWYVLDDEPVPLADVRARRGPGNRSWIRPLAQVVMEKLLTDPSLTTATLRGLFVSPYRAQADAVTTWLRQTGHDNWSASTVHRQQGSEADVVVFDTVHAGSTGWPADEWQRLVNVALSRAREAVVVLASRDEMQEPYLRLLRETLTPAVLVRDADAWRWRRAGAASDPQRVAETHADYAGLEPSPTSNGPDGLGRQIAERRKLSPVLSHEQQRLVDLKLDGKPRLVRGVAGSGKSVVLCHWMAKTLRRTTLADRPSGQVWAVYANRSLDRLLRESVESAWTATADPGGLFAPEPFPEDRVKLMHVRDLLRDLMPEADFSERGYGFDYDRAAEELLARPDAGDRLPACAAIFIDEAQDMGPNTLRLLLSLVEQSDPDDGNSRAAHVFYDNAQNVYDRKTPTWSDYGLDVRGRSTIMRESFRATRQIAEFALNVRCRLLGDTVPPDVKELEELGLVGHQVRDHEAWRTADFCDQEGGKSSLHTFPTVAAEMAAILRHLRRLVIQEHVRPRDITLIYNGVGVADRLTAELAGPLREIGVDLSVQTGRGFGRRANTLLATTPNSYKGYESEVVLIPCADRYVAPGRGVLTPSLYVALTRARSLLLVYGLENPAGEGGRAMDALRRTQALQAGSTGKS